MKASTQEDTMLINTYVPNIGLPKYIKQILTDITKKKRQKYNNSRGL